MLLETNKPRVVEHIVATVCPRGDRWRVWCEGWDDRRYAATRSEAMRAAERALGLPECEVVT